MPWHAIIPTQQAKPWFLGGTLVDKLTAKPEVPEHQPAAARIPGIRTRAGLAPEQPEQADRGRAALPPPGDRLPRWKVATYLTPIRQMTRINPPRYAPTWS